MKQKRAVVTGAGGFIGSHLVTYLRQRGWWVRGVDIKEPEFRASDADEFLLLDLRDRTSAERAMAGMDEAYALAADMGGMGYISQNHARILHSNALINLNSIEAARAANVGRYLYTSSACVYPEHLQADTNVTPLEESQAFPAQPQDAYGWEKLFTELLCRYYSGDYGMETRVARFHNIFGPYGTWDGGREKAPAAICRKVAQAKLTGDHRVEVWGDGEQTRSFCYIDDCLEGIYRLMRSDYADVVNIGQDRMVTINELVDIVASAAGVDVEKVHVPGPEGVRGRNSDNGRVREVLGWRPEVSLEDGLARTYEWIEAQVRDRRESPQLVAPAR